MRLSNRFGIGPTTIAVGMLWGPAMLLVAFAPVGNDAIPVLVAAAILQGFAIVVYNIIQVSYRQAICPPRLQGRMNSVMRFIVWGTIPIGALIGGALGTWVGLRETIVVGAIGGGLAFLWILFSPQRHLREMPEPVEDTPRRPSSARRSPESANRCPRPTTATDVRAWPRGGLWRHPDFLKLWSAETISQIGSAVDDLAIGFVAIVFLDASAFEVAILGTLNFLPFILFTLPAGVWVDRLRRRPILIAGDFARAALLASIPIAYVADALTLWQLYVVVFLTGVCTVFFDVAYQSYLPSLVERDQIIEGNSKLEISRSAAQVGGPGFAGALVEIFTAPYAVLVDALSFVGSGLFLLGIRTQEEPPVRETVDGRKASLWTELKEGLRFVLGNPNLKAQAGCTATSNFFSSLAFSILLVFLVREVGLSAGVIGIVFSIGALSSFAAAFTAMRLSNRFGIGPTTIVVAALFGPAMLIVAFVPEGNAAIPFLIVAQLLFFYTGIVYNIIQVSYRQAICPPRLQGRMNSVMRFMVWGTIPPGTLAGGALGSWVGLRETIVIGAIGAGPPSSGSSFRRRGICARCRRPSRTRHRRQSWERHCPASGIHCPVDDTA